jgi:hypothetical protein
MLNKLSSLSLTLSLFFISTVSVWACPLCGENLAKNNGGFGGGLTMGIVITIFFLLGTFGAILGLVIRMMIKEGKKSDARHALLAAQESSQNP